MRLKTEAVLCFASNDDGLPKVIRDYRARYRTISQVLDKNREILGCNGATCTPALLLPPSGILGTSGRHRLVPFVSDFSGRSPRKCFASAYR
jgi:hypothetical protein